MSQPFDTKFPILAILQNMWVNNPERVKGLIDRHGEEYRLRLIEYALFAGCLTGRRLKQAFGQAILDLMLWEESTREIAGDPRKVFAPDERHIRLILEKYQPKIVIVFGRVAEPAVRKLWTGQLIYSPHPACRRPADVESLMKAGLEARDLMLNVLSQ